MEQGLNSVFTVPAFMAVAAGALEHTLLIPSPEAVARLARPDCIHADSRLERILGRRLTFTESSAAESMASEHASYGSSRFYLQTLLPTRGPTHLASIGHEAAAVAFFVDPEDKKAVVLAYSSESHNGPSYVCPHPGAATGAGGNDRDNAAETATKPESGWEARRQAHPGHNPHHDPVLRHTEETTQGIGDYQNAMGIPHGGGSIKFDPRFAGNNLVNVMAFSVASQERLLSNKVPTSDAPEKFAGIYVGKASDTTGIGGTKFASVAIDMTQNNLNEKAVQDPDPHLQEAVFRGLEKVIDIALREGWMDTISVKDMGAAGLLCSSLEQLHGTIGMVINGDIVPQNTPRTSLELLEAETQERMFLYVHEDHAAQVLSIFNEEIGLPGINVGARAAIVGRCNSSGRYQFVRNGVVDVDVPAEELMKGPLLYRPVKEPSRKKQKILASAKTLQEEVRLVLGSITFKSDALVHSHYDKHVRSTNIVNRGEAAAPLRTHPLFKSKVAYSGYFDSNCVYGLLDPQFQAEDALVRGAYTLATVGCSVVGVANNANYGRTTMPEEMWQFTQGEAGVAKACYNWRLEDEYLEMVSQDSKVAEKLRHDTRKHLTVDTGNCSLNKANANTGTAIPPTTILGLVGWTNAPEHYTTWDMKPVESMLFLVGARQESLAGTDYLQRLFCPESLGDTLFEIDYEQSNKEVGAIIRSVRQGYVAAANVIEEGGLANAVAEMVANTSLPVDVSINLEATMGEGYLTAQQKLFSESYGVVVQVFPEQEQAFYEFMREQGVAVYEIGSVQKAVGQGSLRFKTAFNSHHQSVRLEQSWVQVQYHSKLEQTLEAA